MALFTAVSSAYNAIFGVRESLDDIRRRSMVEAEKNARREEFHLRQINKKLKEKQAHIEICKALPGVPISQIKQLIKERQTLERQQALREKTSSMFNAIHEKLVDSGASQSMIEEAAKLLVSMEQLNDAVDSKGINALSIDLEMHSEIMTENTQQVGNFFSVSSEEDQEKSMDRELEQVTKDRENRAQVADLEKLSHRLNGQASLGSNTNSLSTNQRNTSSAAAAAAPPPSASTLAAVNIRDIQPPLTRVDINGMDHDQFDEYIKALSLRALPNVSASSAAPADPPTSIHQDTPIVTGDDAGDLDDLERRLHALKK